MDNKYNLSGKQLERARKMAQKDKGFYRLVRKYPWVNGLFMLSLGVIGILVYYVFRFEMQDVLLMRLLLGILPFAGILMFFLGVKYLIQYTRNPEKMRKKQEEYHEFLIKK